MKRYYLPTQTAQQGAVLLESLIAILIFSMGILALVGLQAAMIENTAEAKYRADASYIAQQRIGAMWADPDNLASYLEASPGTSISNLLPSGRRTVTQPTPGTFIVTVTWRAPGDPVQHQFSTTASIAGG